MDKSIEYGQMDFTLPHDVVNLPSKGLFYKNKKKSIKVGYLTASDENILLSNAKDITLTLLRNKIYETDLRPEDMLEGDVEAILVFLRNTSFGTEMELNLKDPITKKNFTTVVDLGVLNLIEGQKPDADGTFTTILPRSGDKVKLKPLTYSQLLEIQNIIDSYPDFRISPKATLRVQNHIVEINEKVLEKSDIAIYVEKMPIVDSKYIKKFMSENEPRLDMRKDVITPSGEKLTVDVGFGVDFFRPFFGV